MNEEPSAHGEGIDDLYEWLGRDPDSWPMTDDDDVEAELVERMVSAIVSGDRSMARGRRRRKRRIVAGMCVVVALGGATAAAAAVLNRHQPTRPEAGIVCRAAARVDASAVVIEPSQDPVAGCRQQWQDGAFGGSATSDGIPNLIACVDPRGPINVFPGDDTTCSQLHLQPAASTLAPDAQAAVALQDQVADLNGQGCQSATSIVGAASKLLADAGLTDWKVTVDAAAVHASCVIAAVDSTTKTVTVLSLDG